MNQLADKVAIVVGASRGLGKGVTDAFLAEGASVVAVARDTSPLKELAARHKKVELEAADASDAPVPGRLLRQYRPDLVALVQYPSYELLPWALGVMMVASALALRELPVERAAARQAMRRARPYGPPVPVPLPT